MPLERPLIARLLVRNTVPVNASSFNHKELLAAARAHNLTFKGVEQHSLFRQMSPFPRPRGSLNPVVYTRVKPQATRRAQPETACRYRRGILGAFTHRASPTASSDRAYGARVQSTAGLEENRQNI